MDDDIRMAAGRFFLLFWARQGSVPVKLFGAMVRVIAYESRK